MHSEFFLDFVELNSRKTEAKGVKSEGQCQPGYAVFGRATVELNVVEAIGAVPVGSRVALVSGVSQILTNVPVDEITITATGQIR